MVGASNLTSPTSAVTSEIEVGADGNHVQWFGACNWQAVYAALHSNALSVDAYRPAMDLDGQFGTSLLSMDSSHHRGHRALLQNAFTRSAVQRQASAVEAPIDTIVSRLPQTGSADLLTDLCLQFPALVIAALLDLDDNLAGLLSEQSFVVASADRSRLQDAAAMLFEHLLPVIEARRQRPRGDLISLLASASLAGRVLTDLEVFSQVRLLAIAGTDTVSKATANLLAALLLHPSQMDLIRQDPSLVPAAVEEAVRWECPAVSVPRVAMRDMMLLDTPVPEGSMVRCHISAANHDPTRWSRPDEFRVGRERKTNAGFGLGAHACLGMHLARHLMAHVVRVVFDTLPELALDPAVAPPRIVGEHVRAPTHLQVVWGRG